MSNLTVANTIAQQIGARAFLMMGTRTKVGTENSLIFDVRGSKTVNKIEIIYNYGADDYTVKYYKIRGVNCKLVETVDGLYFDNLKDSIERVTGLYLSL